MGQGWQTKPNTPRASNGGVTAAPRWPTCRETNHFQNKKRVICEDSGLFPAIPKGPVAAHPKCPIIPCDLPLNPVAAITLALALCPGPYPGKERLACFLIPFLVGFLSTWVSTWVPAIPSSAVRGEGIVLNEPSVVAVKKAQTASCKTAMPSAWSPRKCSAKRRATSPPYAR